MTNIEPWPDLAIKCDSLDNFFKILNDIAVDNFNFLNIASKNELIASIIKEFMISDLLEKYANTWTPEMGFGNESLKHNKYASPRPSRGKFNL